MRLSSAVIAVTSYLQIVIFAKSLSSILNTYPQLSIFRDFLNHFELFDRFTSLSNITVFAPSNQAYLDLAQWGFNLSEIEPFIARALLTYHVLEGVWTSESIPSSSTPQVVHTYLRPPYLTNVSDGAAVKLRREGNKIVAESGLQVLGGVEKADIEFEQGVLHVLNSSMVLPHNISVTAQVNGLIEFLDLLSSAHSVTRFEGIRDVTVLIPHNAVLRKLGPLLHMLRPEQVADILEYHIIPGEVLYEQRLRRGNGNFTTLHGGSVQSRFDKSGSLFFNEAQVLRPDLIIYGGVAHVINDILLPGFEPPEYVDDNSQSIVYSNFAKQVLL